MPTLKDVDITIVDADGTERPIPGVADITWTVGEGKVAEARLVIRGVEVDVEGIQPLALDAPRTAEVVQDGSDGPRRHAVTLGTALPAEMARVRDEVLPFYTPEVNGQFAAAAMRASLDAAAKALAEGDAVMMLHAYEDLKGFTL